MSCLWYAGQIGIVLEIFGAAYIVYSAFKAKKSINKDVFEVNELHTVLLNQAREESVGFAMLAIGLVLQFIGGFASA